MPSIDSHVTEVLSQQTTADREITEADIYTAIADVLDPELDEPLVRLGFIDRVQVDGSDVTITFKLPTYWCSPNFAYLMAMDLRDKARSVPGVQAVRVALVDHCTEDEVTDAVNKGQSFSEAFPDETAEDEHLEGLRRTFLRKGFLMRQDTLLRQMLKVGLNEATIATLRMADITVDEPANVAFVSIQEQIVRLEGVGHSAALYLSRRASLHLPLAPTDPLIIDDEGRPLQPGGLKEFLRRSRSIRMNIMVNTTLCKGLFRTRYGQNKAIEDEDE